MTSSSNETSRSDSTTVRVLAGSPTPEETAALVAALDATDDPSAKAAEISRPNWLKAARRESVGNRRIASPADLR